MQFLNLKKQYSSIKKEINKAIKRVLDSGQYIGGKEVEAFEKEVADYCGVKYAISTNSGTDSLYLALKSLGIGKGDEVITTPFTFIATASAIINVGARPVFVDIGEDFNINPDLIEEKVSYFTKAILPVHLFGKMANMEKILNIADKYNLFVIEDACQSIGAEYQGKKAGTWGHGGCLSFYPTKNLGACGDGGMVLTNEDMIADNVRLLKNHGMGKEYNSRVVGINSRLDTIQAAILRVKIKYLDKWNEERRQKAKYYCDKLGIKFYPESIYHQFTLRIKNREKLKVDFPYKIYYPVPLHLQSAFSDFFFPGDFPEAEKASREVISLPLLVNRVEQNKIIRQIKQYV